MATMATTGSRTILVSGIPHFTINADGTVVRHVVSEFTDPSPEDFKNGVKSKDITIDPDTGVYVRLYLPDLTQNRPSAEKTVPILFYVHGGSFCVGSAASTPVHEYMNKVAKDLGVICVSVDYRLVPEHRLPTAYDDSLAALRWLLAGPGRNDLWIATHGDMKRVFFSGDSAGGNIIHELGLRARHVEWPADVCFKGAVFVHPFFSRPRASETKVAEHPDREFLELLLPVGEDLSYPPFNPAGPRSPPLSDSVYERILVCVAEDDFFREGAEIYFKNVVGAGLNAELMMSKGEKHGFHIFNLGSQSTTELLERIRDFVTGI